VGEERGAGRPSEAVEAVTVGGFLSWPSVLLCLGRLSSPVAVVVSLCRGVVVVSPCLRGFLAPAGPNYFLTDFRIKKMG
jgi:hypothetical protein